MTSRSAATRPGAGALISSGTMTLAGGRTSRCRRTGTRSRSSGAAGTETQIASPGIAASNTTYTSGTVTFVGSGNVQVQSGTGQRVIISGSQSVQPETQTFVGGIVGSNATYTSGTVTITGVGGGVTVSSNTGQRIDISVAAPVAQTGTQFSAGISGRQHVWELRDCRRPCRVRGRQQRHTVAVPRTGCPRRSRSRRSTSPPRRASRRSSLPTPTYTSGSVQFTGSNMVTVKSFGEPAGRDRRHPVASRPRTWWPSPCPATRPVRWRGSRPER